MHLRVEIQFAEEGAAVRLLLFVLFARVAPNNYSLVVGADFFDTRWHLARRQEITACSTHAAMYFRARFSRVSTRNAQRDAERKLNIGRRDFCQGEAQIFSNERARTQKLESHFALHSSMSMKSCI